MVDPSQNNDHEETTRLKEGDQDAFNQIFNRYQTKLIVYTAAIVKSEAVAKDLVQETFIRLWVNRRDLDPEELLSGYLHIMTRNLGLNRSRRAGYERDLSQKIWESIQESEQRVRVEEEICGRESHG